LVCDKTDMRIVEDIEGIERRMRELGEELGRLKADEVDVDVVEGRVLEMAKAWGRAQMARAMKLADAEASEVKINGERWGNRRETGHDYETVFGTVALERAVYQQSGRGRVAVPLDLRLGMIEGTYTPRLARIATRALASMPEQEAADLLSEVGTATLSNSTIGRLSRAMAARHEQRREVIEASIRETHVIREQAVTVQVGVDGVMVPQDGEHARPRGRKTRSPEPPRHE
jgi:ketosteroid isomerase-like protein